MNYERLPEYRMSYEDRLTEEAWAIARSRRTYESEGIKWNPRMLNVASINLADVLAGKRPDLEIDIPEGTDYKYARERVDEAIELSRYSFARLKRARTVYVQLPSEWQYINPWNTCLNASWNGMRDPQSVDEFFFHADIPEEELKTVFHFDLPNAPDSVRFFGGYFGFTYGGRQRLTDLVEKPIAFVQLRQTGRNWGRWDLSSREVFNPSAKGNVGI